MQGEAIDQILLQQRFIFSEGGGAMAIGFGESDSFGKLARGEGGNRPLFISLILSFSRRVKLSFLRVAFFPSFRLNSSGSFRFDFRSFVSPSRTQMNISPIHKKQLLGEEFFATGH